VSAPEINSNQRADPHTPAQDVSRTREGLLQVIIDATRETIISIGADGLVTLFNPAAEKMFGRSAAEMIGQPLDCLMPEEYRQSHQHYVRNYFATGKPEGAIGQLLELPGLRANGETFPMAISLTTAKLRNERFVIAVARDITERKQAEDKLRKERRFVTTLVQASPTFFVAISRAGKTLLMNQSMLAALGYTEDEIVGTDYLTTCVPESDRELLANVFRKLTDSRQATLNENRVLTKDGRELLVEWHGRPVFDEKGQFDFFFGVGIDITERRKAEEERRKLEAQVQQAQKLESLGVLAGGIAHDFNNLLVGVLGNAELALDQLSPTSPARSCVQDIETAAMRAAELTRQMLAYSGKGLFVIEQLNLNEVVAEMANLLEVSISKKAILKYNYADHLPPIEIDATQIRQVIMNLITNASEALGDRSGVISISTGAMECESAYLTGTYLDDELQEGVYVYLEVADTGCGMDEETCSKIFDPFFTTKFTGRGLGLAAVLGIMRGHKGALKVQSQPGRGTTFRALFPALDEVVATVPDKSKKAERFVGTGTVLLVDDEETVRAVGKNVLVRAGFSALTASDGPEALELFRKHASEIVCVVLDLTMPLMDGDEAFHRLREIRDEVPVILSSGYNQQEITQRFAGSGLAGFIQKPYRGSELLAKIGDILRQRRSQDSHAPNAE
jgi:PAS domain S-box-containing protein